MCTYETWKKRKGGLANPAITQNQALLRRHCGEGLQTETLGQTGSSHMPTFFNPWSGHKKHFLMSSTTMCNTSITTFESPFHVTEQPISWTTWMRLSTILTSSSSLVLITDHLSSAVSLVYVYYHVWFGICLVNKFRGATYMVCDWYLFKWKSLEVPLTWWSLLFIFCPFI